MMDYWKSAFLWETSIVEETVVSMEFQWAYKSDSKKGCLPVGTMESSIVGKKVDELDGRSVWMMAI